MANGAPEWYPQFVEWWRANVRTPQDAAYGRAYYQQRLQADQNREMEKKAEKQQKQADITGAATALGVPLAYAGGQALIGAATSPAAVGAGVGQAASVGAPQLLSVGRLASPAQVVPTGAPSAAGGAAGASSSGGGFLASSFGRGASGIGGAYGMYDVLKKPRSPVRGTVQGAASGAALGNAIVPGAGAIPGAIIGATLGLGRSLLGGSKERFKEEWNRKKKLVDAGILPAEQLGEQLSRGRSTDELAAIEQAKVGQGQYGNTKFAKSRNVADLTPYDIWGYSTPYETLGRSYTDASPEQRYEFNRQLLERGLVGEGRGQISYKDPTQAKSIWDQVLSTENLPKLPSYQDTMNKIGSFGPTTSPTKMANLPAASGGMLAMPGPGVSVSTQEMAMPGEAPALTEQQKRDAMMRQVLANSRR